MKLLISLDGLPTVCLPASPSPQTTMITGCFVPITGNSKSPMTEKLPHHDLDLLNASGNLIGIMNFAHRLFLAYLIYRLICCNRGLPFTRLSYFIYPPVQRLQCFAVHPHPHFLQHMLGSHIPPLCIRRDDRLTARILKRPGDQAFDRLGHIALVAAGRIDPIADLNLSLGVRQPLETRQACAKPACRDDDQLIGIPGMLGRCGASHFRQLYRNRALQAVGDNLARHLQSQPLFQRFRIGQVAFQLFQRQGKQEQALSLYFKIVKAAHRDE